MADLSPDEEISALIPEREAWGDGWMGPSVWLTATGTYPLAVGYSLLFWPRFVLIGDYVLRHGTEPEDVAAWEAHGNSPEGVEAVLNHIHIGDIHTSAEGDEAQFRYLGRVLKDIHETKLKTDFPDRTFIVDFNDEPGLDLIDYQLTFWQPRE